MTCRRGFIGAMCAAVLAVISGLLAFPAQAMTKAVHVGREVRAEFGVGTELSVKAATFEELRLLGLQLGPDVKALAISSELANAITREHRSRDAHPLDGGFFAIYVSSEHVGRIPVVVNRHTEGLRVHLCASPDEAVYLGYPPGPRVNR